MSEHRLADAEPIAPDALWPTARAVGRRAAERGTLEPITARMEAVPEAGIAFVARVVEGMKRKIAATRGQRETGRNPFLPWEDELFVGLVSDTHAALLNKYPVLDDHVLLVTRRFLRQEAALDRDDWHALLWGLSTGDVLAFYNGGRASGASQPHKHLQLAPPPLGDGPEAFPLEPALEAAAPDGGSGGGIGTVPALPFAHALARMEPAWWAEPDAGAEPARARYRALLAATDCETGGDPRPYSLLATRRHLLVVPRARGEHEGIPVNALAYGGGLFARDEEQLRRIRALGPLRVLLGGARPRP